MAMPEHGQPSKMNSYQSNRTDPGVGLLDPPPSLVLDGFEEPAFDGAKWLDVQNVSGAAGASMVDHPLMRGLMMELPPRGSQPSTEWMDRWFEAARAVLDLIYNPTSKR